jgi:hypothetical protein
MVQANRYSNEFDTESDEAEVDEDSEDVDEDEESGESEDDNSDEGEDEEEGDEEEESGEDEDEDGEETGDEDDEETGDDEDEEEESDEDEDEAHDEEDEFADEPGAAEPSNIEGDETDDVPTDEPEGQDSSKSTEEEDKRKTFLMFLACICCCLVIIIAVVLGVVLGGKDNDDESKEILTTPVPVTSIPSTSPAPSFVPTLHPVQIFFPVVADTYLRSGEFADRSFGTSEDLEVRNGLGDSNVAYMLLQFDLSGLPSGDSDNIFRPREVILRLSHVESVATGSANITVVKLPSDSNLDIESLTYQDFTPSGGEDGPTFVVAPDDTDVEVDITAMIEASNTQLRGRRHLQREKIIIMLESRDSNNNLLAQLFRSREYQNGDFEPMIVHNFVTPSPTASPTVSSAPTTSSKPTMLPTISAAPTTSTEPSYTPTSGSLPPPKASGEPSSSSKPSVSVSPSLQPSTSAQPSLSLKPTVNPTDSAKPSNGATSEPPTNSPSVSSKPSVSRQPTSAPTVSDAPSISSQPSTCQEQITPPLVEVVGTTTTPFPEGAVEYVSQDGTEVTMRIIQKWSDKNVAWIVPYFADTVETKSCVKSRDLPPLGTIEVTLFCFEDRQTFAVIVNDSTFVEGADLELPEGCTTENDDLAGQKVLYEFNLKCSPPAPSCLE